MIIRRDWRETISGNEARIRDGFALLRAMNSAHSPICRLARSFMISSLPPPIALTLTSR
jgi:hypothetical protein